MRRSRRPLCYGCAKKPARPNSAFCSQHCAVRHTERHIMMNYDWCGECRAWIWVQDQCEHFIAALKDDR